MSAKIYDSKEVQDFLRVIANLGSGGGNERVKKVVHRILSDLFKTIEEFDLTPTEIWSGINYINKVGSDGEAALLAAGLGLEHYIDLRLDAEDEALGIAGGTPRTIEGPLYVAGAPVVDSKARLDKDPDPDAAPLRIHGTVTDPDGKPVVGALVELWHSDSKGFYSHFDPTGRQSEFNLRGAIKTGADGKYEALTKMPASYGCPPSGATQTLLNQLNRHGNRPAHVHIFVTAERFRKLTTQFNIEGDPLIWDDFAFATRDGLIPHIVGRSDGRTIGFEQDTYKDIEFNLELTSVIDGRDNQVVERARAGA